MPTQVARPASQGRKRQADDNQDDRGRSGRVKTQRQRSVSFSRQYMPGLVDSIPGHRTTSPSRSSIRSPSPSKEGADRISIRKSARAVSPLKMDHSDRDSPSAGPQRKSITGPSESTKQYVYDQIVAASLQPSLLQTRASASAKQKLKALSEAHMQATTKAKPSSRSARQIRERDRTPVEPEEVLRVRARSATPSEQQVTESIEQPSMSLEEHLDQEVCQRVHDLRAAVLSLASQFARGRQLSLHTFLSKDAVETCRYIECLVMPERNGARFWQDLLSGPHVPTLVAALIGRALQVHVLGALYFGGTDEQIAELEKDEQKDDNSHSHERAFSRAKICKRFMRSQKAYDRNVLNAAQQKVAVQILYLILPLYKPRGAAGLNGFITRIFPELLAIVDQATFINHSLRCDGDTMWQWTDIWKDTRFDPQTTECVNLTQVFEQSRSDDGTRARRDAEAIVRVVVFPGLVAWRRRFDEMKTSIDAPVVKYDAGDKHKRIMKNVALVEWAKQRLLTKYAGTAYHQKTVASGDMGVFENDGKGAVDLWDLLQQWKQGVAIELT